MRRNHQFDEWRNNHPSQQIYQDYDQPGLILASPDHHERHEHGSDPDETDDESVFPRVRSFDDAEDYVNNISSRGANFNSNDPRYLQSPVAVSTLPHDGNGNHTLHHRSRQQIAFTPMNGTVNSSVFEEDESPRHRLLRQLPSLNLTGSHHRQNKRSWTSSSPSSPSPQHRHHGELFQSFLCWKGSSYTLVRWCFLLGLGSYLVLLSKSTYYLGQHQDYHQPAPSSDADMPWKVQMQHRQRLNQQKQQHRHHHHPFYFSSSRYFGGGWKEYYAAKWFQQRQVQVEDALLQHDRRAVARRQRTNRPASKEDKSLLDWHRIASLNEARPYQSIQDQIRQESQSDVDNIDVITPATVDQLCGFQAKNASLSHPQFYPARAALNSNSRVLITGILNPVGFSLALYLKEKCGVELIAGVDAMYPNTVYNRLMLQERIKILTTNIPKLVKPLFLSFVGLDPLTKMESAGKVEMNWIEGFEPTHIVHLASFSMETMYNDALVDPQWKNTRSPYVLEEQNGDNIEISDPFLYPMRSSMASIEQLLQSIVSVSVEERPQLIYAKQAASPTAAIPVSHANANSLENRELQRSSFTEILGQMDGILVDTFHAHHDLQVPSIGLRLPNGIYGPWGHAGSVIHEMLERAAEAHQDRNSNVVAGTIRSILPTDVSPASRMDMLFVDDAVEALVSAMQHRTEQPLTVFVEPQESATITSIVSIVQSFLDQSNTTTTKIHNPFLDRLLADHGNGWAGVNGHVDSLAQSLILPTKRTPLKDGLLHSMAWHLDKIAPFGASGVETGDEFLRRHDKETCSSDDVTCHKSFSFLPCNSECNIHEKCLPSIFDPVRELVHNVSDGCDIVLYTQSLGYDVEDMDLQAEYMDDKDLDADELLVCNFAFVPRESRLVSSVSRKVPNDQLSKFGIKPEATDARSKAMTEKKLDGLNGRLLYRGWILIWIPDGTKPLNPMDQSLLKISPSKLFHPGVKYGVFVEENFSVSPNLEDVLFLVDEMSRRSFPDRTLKKEEKIQTPNGVVSKKIKYRIPREPPRRAAILFAPLRYPNIDDPVIQQYRNGNRKLSIYDAAKFMRFEVGYELGEKEPSSLRRQREYYERIPSYINKNTEMRSSYEPWYRFIMRHWVRTRWVVHDFDLEESRQLRCDWYQEHVQWGNDLDQLSFANVMATRELNRRVAHREPDDHVMSFIEEHPELHDLTDSYEWHPMETDINKLHREPTYWKSHLPEHVQVAIDSVGKVQHAAAEEGEDNEKSMPLYIRIMSERVMAASRKIWTKTRRQILKAKAQHK